MKFIEKLEDHSFHCDPLETSYDIWNNKAAYLSPIFIPYIDLFLVKEMGLLPPKWREGRPFCVVITHDVDTIGKTSESARVSKKELMIKKEKYQIKKYLLRIASFSKIVAYTLLSKLPGGTKKEEFPIERWLEFEEKFGIKSTFFFFPQAEENETVYHDCTYKYYDKVDFYGKRTPLYEVIREIKKLGWEVGIHGSILSARNPNILKKQKERTEKILGFSVKSIRHHWLSFEPKITPYFQKEVGFEYDSTFGFNMVVGFRAGTSYPFIWMNINQGAEKKGGTTEVPPIIQDGALFQKYSGMGLDLKKAMGLCKFIADEVRDVGGVLTIIWHTNYFYKNENQGGIEFLAEFLKYCKSQGAWITSLGEMMKYWQTKKYGEKIEEKIKKINYNELINFSISYMKQQQKRIFD